MTLGHNAKTLLACLSLTFGAACGGTPSSPASTSDAASAVESAVTDGDISDTTDDSSAAHDAIGVDDTSSTTPPTSDGGTTPPDAITSADSSAAPVKHALGKYVVTWYSFQDNTPVNSALSASGRKLIPYLSVALPFRFLKAFGGTLDYGDPLYIEFLDGRTMPNGKKHTGWVQIDDFCGDSGDDSYCFQTVGGTSYPNTDLYIGDFVTSGMDPKACTGPAGSGQELTNVSTGSPGSAWISDYGGNTLGTGTCGDVTTAKSQQGACWDYTPPASSSSMCSGCTKDSCAGH
jgi:hypothetical protein